jgi:hypothetical protein
MKPPLNLSGFSATNGVERVERELHSFDINHICSNANNCETPPSDTHSTEHVSLSENLSNERADHTEYPHHEEKKSQYRGVSYDRKKSKWRVQIKVAALGKSGVSVGYFDTEEAAARAYDRAAIGLLGRDAPHLQTNFDILEYTDESIPDLSGKTREEVKTTLKCERVKQAPRKRFVSRQRTSQYMGVGSSNRKNQWQARILVHGKVTHLGYYETEEDAARVYDRVSLALHGNQAQTNFAIEHYPEEEIKQFVGLERESLQRALGVKPMDKSSKFRGVSKKKGKWEAKVMVNRRWAYRELFDSEEAAARAYDMALWRLKPSEAASYVNFKDEPHGEVAGASAAPAARSMDSVEYAGEFLKTETDNCEEVNCYSSDGDFEYEYRPTKGTSRSEKMRAKKNASSEKDLMSLRKPSPVRTKRQDASLGNKHQPKFSLVPGEGLKFTNITSGTSLESASTPLADNGMIPNLSNSSFHDQEELMVRVGSETHLIAPISNSLPLHNDPCVQHRNHRPREAVHGVPTLGMKRANSEPYIQPTHIINELDPLEGIDDLINDADVFKGVDLGLLTGSVGEPEDQGLIQIQDFVIDHQDPYIFNHNYGTAVSNIDCQPKPRKLSKSVSMQNLACEDVSAAASNCGAPKMKIHQSDGGSSGKPPCMPPIVPGKCSDNLSIGALGGGASTGSLRRVNTFTCSLPFLEESDTQQTPNFRNSNHNSSDEDLVKQLWAGEATIPSLLT